MTKLSRRNLITATPAAAAVALVPVRPALAADVKWQLVTEFDRRRDAIRQPMVTFAKTVAQLTGGTFQIALDEDGQAGPAMIDAVATGKTPLAHARPSSGMARNPVFALADGVPFGLNARMQQAWLRDRQGLAVYNAAIATQNLIAIPCGAIGAQMGGWFKTAVSGVADLKDKPVAIDGLGAKVLEKLGGKPVSLEADVIAPALASGEIFGAVWGAPYDDENLRLYQAARVLHYPGWWNGSSQLCLFANKAQYDALAPGHKAALSTAAALADAEILARYDAQNPAALKRAVASGAQLEPFNEGFLDDCYKASGDVMAAIAKDNAAFKQIHEAIMDMRRDGYLWVQLAENTFDTYMMIQQRKQTL